MLLGGAQERLLAGVGELQRGLPDELGLADAGGRGRERRATGQRFLEPEPGPEHVEEPVAEVKSRAVPLAGGRGDGDWGNGPWGAEGYSFEQEEGKESRTVWWPSSAGGGHRAVGCLPDASAIESVVPVEPDGSARGRLRQEYDESEMLSWLVCQRACEFFPRK